MRCFSPIILLTIAASVVFAREVPKRPLIVGVAHIALRTNDMAAERAFYGKGMGFEEISGGRFKVNDHQCIQVSARSEKRDGGSPGSYRVRDYQSQANARLFDGSEGQRSGD